MFCENQKCLKNVGFQFLYFFKPISTKTLNTGFNNANKNNKNKRKLGVDPDSQLIIIKYNYIKYRLPSGRNRVSVNTNHAYTLCTDIQGIVQYDPISAGFHHGSQ